MLQCKFPKLSCCYELWYEVRMQYFWSAFSSKTFKMTSYLKNVTLYWCVCSNTMQTILCYTSNRYWIMEGEERKMQELYSSIYENISARKCSYKDALYFCWIYYILILHSKAVQGSTKRQAPGLVNFVPALAYYFCLNLPAAFMQPGACLSGALYTKCSCKIISQSSEKGLLQFHTTNSVMKFRDGLKGWP